ncbi:hypothetical protein ACSDQ9_07660 [Aestuariimicrobium soli]|uniref:hypothetical protein n=1 Tax=Aestuariimicrobium soli TaxID=2035834 RepID=UPI003EB8F84A
MTQPERSRRVLLAALDGQVTLELLDGDDPAADDLLWQRLLRAWSRCLVDGELADDAGSAGQRVTVRLGRHDPFPNDANRVQGTDPDPLMQLVTQQVTHAFIEQQVGRLFLAHAGGVTHPVTGASLVFIAPGGTGKTTLACTLARQYGYLSDETVGMRTDGTIAAYPKPLSLRGTDPHKAETSPDDLGLLPAHATPWLAKLVVLDRVALATSGVRVSPLATLDAIEAMASQTSSLGRLPRALHVVADLLASTGGAERWTYTEHTDLLDRAATLLGGRP